MAARMVEMLLFTMSLFVLILLLGATTTTTMAQNSQSSSCTNVILSLSPCLDYITGRESIPSSGCCSQLAYVVGSQPQCLCEVVNGGAASSIAASLNINQTLVLGLPSVCRVQTPPISMCSGSGSGSDSASSSSSFPTPTGVSVSNVPNYPSGIGSNTFSSSTTGGSGGGSFRWNSSSTKLASSSLMLLFLLATTLTFTFMTTA